MAIALPLKLLIISPREKTVVGAGPTPLVLTETT